MLNMFIHSEWKTLLIFPYPFMMLHTFQTSFFQTSLVIYEEFCSKFSCYLLHVFYYPCHPSPNLFLVHLDPVGAGGSRFM